MDTEKDQNRFDRALNEVEKFGGSVRLTSWANKKQRMVPETSSDWGDISTMLRHHVIDTNSGVSLLVTANGRTSEFFNAIWKKAEREPLDREIGHALPEEAMDTLIFQDKGKFHFDAWNEGKPYRMVNIDTTENNKSTSIFQKTGAWVLGIITAIIIAVIVKYLGLNGS